MPRILAASIALALLAAAGSARGEAPFFLTYLMPAGSGCDLGQRVPPVDLGDPLNPPATIPSVPAVDLPVGGAATPFDLCFLHWPQDNSSQGTVGIDGNGTEVCAVKLSYGVLSPPSLPPGIVVTEFTLDASVGEFLSNLPDPTLFVVAGGQPLAPCMGGSGVVGVRLATMKLQGTGPNSGLELQTGTFANASNQPKATKNQTIAMTLNTCGNGPPADTNAGEECDDGNSDAGDGCLNCRLEDGFSLQGQASATNPGSIEFEVNGVPVTVALSANSPADEVITLVVARINDTSGVSAVAVDESSLPPGNAQRMVTDGGITANPAPSIVDPVPQGTLQFIPEPDRLLMLLSGIAFLLAVGHSRIQA